MVKDNPKTQPKRTAGKKQRSAIADVVAREYTIHLHKRVSRDHSLSISIRVGTFGEQCCDEDKAPVWESKWETSGGGTLEHERQITSDDTCRVRLRSRVSTSYERSEQEAYTRTEIVQRIEEREGSYTAHKPAGTRTATLTSSPGIRCPIQEACSSCHQRNPQVRDSSHGRTLPPLFYTAFGLHTHTLQGTLDVRLDPQLNKRVWESGIKATPYRLRVRISRKRNDEEGAKEKLYSYVQAVNVKDRDAKGLQTVVVEES